MEIPLGPETHLAFLPGALPSPGTSRDFDAARDFVLRAAREGDVFGASTLSAAKSAAAAACRVVSATATDLAADRDRWRAVVDAAAEVDVLRAFAERTGPDAKTPPGCAFVRPAFLREDEDVSPRDPEDAGLDAGRTSSTEASRRLVERGGGGGGNRLFLRGSWHPLAARPAAPFVRNDVALGGADAPAMLLTGANMGGKMSRKIGRKIGHTIIKRGKQQRCVEFGGDLGSKLDRNRLGKSGSKHRRQDRWQIDE